MSSHREARVSTFSVVHSDPASAFESTSPIHRADGIDNRIAVGMDFDAAIAVIKRQGGEDSTSLKQVMTPPGATPNRGGYWWLQTYEIQIAIGEHDGRVFSLSYWDGRDLGVSKIHESKTERRVKSLTFDSAGRRVSDERLADR
jgi:hypothetical protein